MKLLIIEDSEPLRRSLMVGFNNLGFTVDESSDGAIGLSMALNNQYDVIILDLMLPHIEGMKILKTIRPTLGQTKILILSAKNHTQDRVEGLLEGADDYLTKPFSFEELHARVIALIRRNRTENTSNIVIIGDFSLDLERKVFCYKSQLIHLTRNEFKIIQCLFFAQGKIVNSEMLSEAIIGNFDHISKNTIEAHISSIRKKVRELGGELPIKNKRGFGYTIQ